MWPQQLLFVSRIAEKVNGHFYSSITVDTASKTRRDDVPVLGEYNRLRETHRQRGYAKQLHREGFGLRPMKFYELFAPLSSRRSLSHHVAAALLRLRCPCAEELHKRGRIGAPLLVVLGLAPDLVRQQNCNWAEAESGSSSDYISTGGLLAFNANFRRIFFFFFFFFFSPSIVLASSDPFYSPRRAPYLPSRDELESGTPDLASAASVASSLRSVSTPFAVHSRRGSRFDVLRVHTKISGRDSWN